MFAFKRYRIPFEFLILAFVVLFLLGSIASAQTVNLPPTISGIEKAYTVKVGQEFRLYPVIKDPEGTKLVIVIQNRPSWAVFSWGSGSLKGTPTAAHVGIYKDIRIFANDHKTNVGSIRFTITVVAADPVPQPNRAPLISGTPPSTATVGVEYVFRPRVIDPDGDALSFTVQYPPPGSTFDETNGEFKWTPAATQVGTRSQIAISVSDGRGGVASLPFGQLNINPAPVVVSKATLSWTPPTQNTDGTSLTNLAGYRIYYGASATALVQTIEIKNAAVSSFIVDNLTAGKWFFAVTAFNADGKESVMSNVASKVIG